MLIAVSCPHEWHQWLEKRCHVCQPEVGGGFKDFICSSLPGEMIQFASYFSKGLKPPTREVACFDIGDPVLVGLIHGTHVFGRIKLMANVYSRDFRF